MKQTIHYRRFAWNLSMLDMYHDDAGPHKSGHGFYRHSSGYCVRIYYDDGYGKRQPHTSLDMNFGAICYIKTINQLYSQRGLQLLCARYVSDVLSGNIEKQILQQKKQTTYEMLKK